MKRHLLLLPMALILCGCAVPPPEKIPNTKCIKGDFEIQQVYDDGFLLKACQYLPHTGIWHCPGPDAFLKVKTSKDPWNNYAEGMHLTTPLSASCLVQNGTYKYTTVLGVERTIINLSGGKSQIPNPEYEKWKAEQDSKNVEENTDSKPKE